MPAARSPSIWWKCEVKRMVEVEAPTTALRPHTCSADGHVVNVKLVHYSYMHHHKMN